MGNVINFEYDESLPKELREQLVSEKAKRTPKWKPVILRLVNEKPGLNMNQLLIGFHDITNHVMRRKQMFSHLRDLKKQDLLSSPRYGFYRLTAKGQKTHRSYEAMAQTKESEKT